MRYCTAKAVCLFVVQPRDLSWVALPAGLNPEQDWNTLVALLVVQVLASASLGITVDRVVHEKQAQWFVLVSFSVVAPIGLGIGWLCAISQSTILAGVMQCIAAGCLLQMAIAQIIPRSFAQCIPGVAGPELSHLLWMVVAGFSGAALFSTLAYASLASGSS